LASLDDIYSLKEFSGWGNNDIKIFGWTLIINSFRCTMTSTSIWQESIRENYLSGKDLLDFYRSAQQSFKNASYIRNNFMKLKKWVLDNMSWDIGSEGQVLVGIDPIHLLGVHIFFW